MAKTKFNTGDKVKIKLGHLMWLTNGTKKKVKWFDARPDLVGQEDIVERAQVTQGVSEYSLKKNGAWFTDRQLKMVSKNPNRL